MKNNTQKAKAKAWKVCSEYNRRKFADENGYTKCVSCGKVFHWKVMDAGHFIPRARSLKTYFEEMNINPQCKGCNGFDPGMLIPYTRFMDDFYGREEVDKLRARSREKANFRLQDYLDILEDYKIKLGALS